jgi:hypothetical protein
MSAYTPDRWVIVRVKSDRHPTIDKVLGSWYGGFAGSDNWRFSSGIEKVEEFDSYYEATNYSGSVYTLHKNAIGMSAYTENVYNRLAKGLTEENMGTMEIIDIKELNDNPTH